MTKPRTPLPRTLLWSLAGSLALAPASFAQTVWTVDDDGGAAFTSIQAAVDAASDGDVIVVSDGSYAEFTLDGKGLAVLADEAAAVVVQGTPGAVTTLVRNVPAGQRALLRGLTFAPSAQLFGRVLSIESCAGTVWIEDVAYVMPSTFPLFYFLAQEEATWVGDSAAVVFVGSTLPGADGATPGQGNERGSVALRSENSAVFVHGCDLRTGASLVETGTGRTGVFADGGLLVLRDSLVQGGTGGPEGLFGSSLPGDGGPGLTVEGGATVWSIGTTLQGGEGGFQFVAPPAEMGPPSVVLNGALEERNADPALLMTTSVVRDDVAEEDAVLDLQTEPGSAAVLAARLFDSAPLFVPGLPGFLGVGPAPILLPAGLTDATGALSVSIGIPTLPPGLATWSATVQMGVATPAGRLELSNPSIFTVIDAP
ncbi:MAG: hypothetical protein AAF628_26540 [Planctomycetota bacterium]